MAQHIINVTNTAAQSLYAIKLLKAHGLNDNAAYTVCYALVVSLLTYASCAWYGFCTAADIDKLQSVLNRAARWGYYKRESPDIVQLCVLKDSNLFSRLLSNPTHVLHPYLPPMVQHEHNLRQRAHNRQLPRKTNPHAAKTFMNRTLYTSLSQ